MVLVEPRSYLTDFLYCVMRLAQLLQTVISPRLTRQRAQAGSPHRRQIAKHVFASSQAACFAAMYALWFCSVAGIGVLSQTPPHTEQINANRKEFLSERLTRRSFKILSTNYLLCIRFFRSKRYESRQQVFCSDG